MAAFSGSRGLVFDAPRTRCDCLPRGARHHLGHDPLTRVDSRSSSGWVTGRRCHRISPNEDRDGVRFDVCRLPRRSPGQKPRAKPLGLGGNLGGARGHVAAVRPAPSQLGLGCGERGAGLEQRGLEHFFAPRLATSVAAVTALEAAAVAAAVRNRSASTAAANS